MKTMFIKIAIVLCFFSGIIVGQSGVHEHDGFFLRMALGAGYAELVEKNVMGSDMKFSGACSALRFQIGGTVAENLILYGDLGGVVQVEPEFEWQGQSASTSDVSVSVFDIGGGITYYLMPSNFYFSLSLLSSQAVFENNNSKGESQFGFGVNAMIGKEWWVGDDWAIGAAIYGYYSSMKDKADPASGQENDINNLSVGVIFSATYH